MASWPQIPLTPSQVRMPNLLHSLVVLSLSALLFLFFKSRTAARWHHLPVAKNQVLHLQKIIAVLVGSFCISTMASPYRYMMPLAAFFRHCEEWTGQHAMLDFDVEYWNHYSLYCAGISTGMTVALLVAYNRILKSAHDSMEAIGAAFLQLSKVKDAESGHVTFQLAEPPSLRPKCKCAMKLTHQAGLAVALLLVVVALLPSVFMHTFAYTIVDGEYFKITSDHVLATLILLYVFNLSKNMIQDYSEVLAGFSKAKFALCNFSIVYGSALAIASTLFLTLANDIMFTYIFKVFALYHQRATHADALAHDIVIPDANYFSASFANYLVDSTYAAMNATMPRDEAIEFLRTQTYVYRDIYIDLIQLLVFGGAVFVPVVVGSLVLGRLS